MANSRLMAIIKLQFVKGNTLLEFNEGSLVSEFMNNPEKG